MGELNNVPNELLEKIKNKVTKEFNLTKEVSSRIVDVIFAGVGNDLSLYFKDAHGEELFLLDVIDNGLLTRVGQDYKHTLKIASQITPEESIIKKEKKELLRNVLEKVANNNKESAIIKYRLLNGRKKTLQELADEFGVSRERIRQIERNIFKKVRVKLEEMGYNFNDLH
jgi:RNA polymerase sigma factor (sigma-70 family)